MSTSRSEAPQVAALYFDGVSARAHVATISLDGEALRLQAGELSRREPLASLRLSEPMGLAPRLITFADGAHVEVRDHASLAALLDASGHSDRLAVRAAFDARIVLVCLAGLVLVVWLGMRYGLPWAAAVAAPQVPDAVVAELSSRTLDFIDDGLLAPSSLDLARQQGVRDALTTWTDLPHRLLFRAGGRVGANAFALPDGTLIVTDELVALAGDDDRVLAVLMHELGHVDMRHGMRMLLQGSAVALFMTWYVGDVSSLLSIAPTVLLQSGYSRDMEREADAYAAKLLRKRGRSPLLLADMLERLARAHGVSQDATGAWLSSHPDTASRIEALRRSDFAAD
ncbi:M48 family metallopeptidase [Methyloversatilis sp.]|uniref:M48 family metallopeptidase n=1 Tax=Methyloversatilis sp. TaxID=2569862 RepID=UPI0035AE9067